MQIVRLTLGAHLAMLLAGQSKPAEPSAEEVIARMVAADNARLAKSTGYTGKRRYHLENKRFKVTAEMSVSVVCNSHGAKTFQILSSKGPGAIRGRVFQPMLDAETDGTRKESRQDTRLLPANYDFRMIGQEVLNGRNNFVLEATPKTQNKYLIQGRIWVDAEDYATTRMEGSPSKNPSFWTRKIRIEHRYVKTGGLWLPIANRSEADVMIFGTTLVTIDYSDYVINP